MPDTDPDLGELRDLYDRLAERNEFYDWIGVEPVEVERGRFVGRVEFEDKLTTPRVFGVNTLHGGILMTLIDLSAAAAVLTRRSGTVATTDVDASFHRAVRETVRAEAEVEEVGDTSATVSVTVRTESSPEDPVATGRVTCKFS